MEGSRLTDGSMRWKSCQNSMVLDMSSREKETHRIETKLQKLCANWFRLDVGGAKTSKGGCEFVG